MGKSLQRMGFEGSGHLLEEGTGELLTLSSLTHPLLWKLSGSEKQQPWEHDQLDTALCGEGTVRPPTRRSLWPQCSRENRSLSTTCEASVARSTGPAGLSPDCGSRHWGQRWSGTPPEAASWSWRV